MEDIKVLQKLPLFHTLDHLELVKVGKCVHVKRYKDGEVLIEQGDTAGAFYILKSGTAQVYLTTEEGEDKILGHFEPTDSFGEISLIDKGERSASVRAEGEIEVLIISREEFQELLHRGGLLSQKLMKNLLHDLCEKLRRTNHFLLLSE